MECTFLPSSFSPASACLPKARSGSSYVLVRGTPCACAEMAIHVVDSATARTSVWPQFDAAPSIVQLNFYSDQVSEDDNILYYYCYDNRTGLLLGETFKEIPGIQCKATNNRMTAISVFVSPIEDHCCQKDTTLYVTRLPQSCSACACEEDVACGPCGTPNHTGCGCESVSDYEAELSSLLLNS